MLNAVASLLISAHYLNIAYYSKHTADRPLCLQHPCNIAIWKHYCQADILLHFWKYANSIIKFCSTIVKAQEQRCIVLYFRQFKMLLKMENEGHNFSSIPHPFEAVFFRSPLEFNIKLSLQGATGGKQCEVSRLAILSSIFIISV